MKIEIYNDKAEQLLEHFPEGYTVEQCVNALISASRGNKPKKGEWWYCHLKQGCMNRITVIYRATDDLWNLPEERINHFWRQEDVKPLSKAVIISGIV